MTVISGGSPAVFSHETVAAKVGIAARTVYRYFPTRADLITAMWAQRTRELNLQFPTSVDESPGWVARRFRLYEKDAPLVRAWAAVPSEQRAGFLEHASNRENWGRLIRHLVPNLTPPERGRVISVLQAICSASTWCELRDAGGLSAEGAAKAGQWAVQALLDSLGRCQGIGS